MNKEQPNERNAAKTTPSTSTLRGTLRKGICYSHKYNGTTFYKSQIWVPRKSGVIDKIPVVIPEHLLNTFSCNSNGKYVQVTGQMYSHDMMVSYSGEGMKHHLHIFFLVDSITDNPEKDGISNNIILLYGKLCRNAKQKKTRTNGDILEFFVAVSKPERGRNNIPCVAWGENARIINALMPGTPIVVRGRAQSRQYEKKDPLNPGVVEQRTVYEIAVSSVQV